MSIKDIIANNTDLNNVDKVIELFSTLQNKIRDVDSSLKEDIANDISSAFKSIDNILNDSSVTQSYKDYVEQYILEPIKSLSTELSKSSNLEDTKKIIAQLVFNFNELSQAITGSKDKAHKLASDNALEKYLTKINTTLQKDSAMPSGLKDRYVELASIIELFKDAGDTSKQMSNQVALALQQLDTELQKTGQIGSSFFAQIQKSASSANSQLFARVFSIYTWINYLKRAITVATDFNSALTNMSYTMDVGKAQLDSFANSMRKMAISTTSSLQNVESVYKIYANMKTNIKEIEDMASSTLILSNLTGMDASQAADDIQAVVAQFSNLNAQETSHIIDVMDYISSNIAVDYSKGIQGMSNAVKNVGNVADQAGLSFEKLSAIIGTTMEQTRQSGESIGNALRTIMVRLSKASNLDETIDNETLSKASASLNEIGIAVYNASGEYRSFDIIMSELANKWDQLTDAQRANISFNIAATRQTSILSAVLKNWAASSELAANATNNSNNALKNQAKYEASLAGKIQASKTNISAMVSGLEDSTVINVILDLAKAVTKLLSVIPAGGLFTAIIGGLSAIKNIDKIKQFTTSLSQIENTINLVKEAQNNADIAKAITGLSVEDSRLALRGSKKYSSEEIEDILRSEEVIADKQKVSLGIMKARVLTSNEYNDSVKKSIVAAIESSTIEGKLDKEKLENKLEQLVIDGAINDAQKQSILNNGVMVSQNKTISASLDTIALKLGITKGALIGISVALAAIGIAWGVWKYHTAEIEKQDAAAKNAASSFASVSKSLKEYKKEYESLNEVIANSDSEDDVLQARQKLLDLQKRINEEYGISIDKVNLLNNSIKNIDDINKKISTNEAEKFLNTNEKSIRRASKQLEQSKDYIVGFYSGEQLTNEVRDVLKKYGATISEYNEVIINSDGFNAEETIANFKKELKTVSPELASSLTSELQDALLKASSLTDDYLEIYEQGLLSKIITDDDKINVDDYYYELVEAITSFDDALLKSDNAYTDAAVNSAYSVLKNMREELENKINTDPSWSVYKYVFDKMFDEAGLSNLDFVEELKKANNYGINILSNAFKGMDDISAEAFINSGDVADAIGKDWTAVTSTMDKYNISIEELINTLVGLGIMSRNTSADVISFADKISNSDEKIDNLQKNLEDVYTAYNALLNPTDNASATIDNIQQYVAALKNIGASDQIAECKDLASMMSVLDDATSEYIENFVNSSDLPKDFAKSIAESVIASKKSAAQLAQTNNSIDNLQSAYSSLNDICTQYNQTGYITFDQLQTLLAMDSQYLSALVDQNGQLSINRASMEALAKAAIDQAKATATQELITELINISTQDATASNYDAVGGYKAAGNAAVDYAKRVGLASGSLEYLKEVSDELLLGASSKNEKATRNAFQNWAARIKLIDSVDSSLGSNFENIMGGGSSSGGSSSADKSSKKRFDWFELRIKELDDAIETANAHLENLVGAKSKNTIIDTLQDIYSVKSSDLQAGIDLYTKEMDKALQKIPENLREAVQNGALALSEFDNQPLEEAINNFRELQDKVQELGVSLEEVKGEMRELELQKFNNVADDYDKVLGVTDTYRDKIQSIIDLQENYGEAVGEPFYDTLIEETRIRKKVLEDEFNELSAQMEAAVNSGIIKVGSDEWKEMYEKIEDVSAGILECTSNVEDYTNAILEIRKARFEDTISAVESLNSEMERYISLLNGEHVTDQTVDGNMTAEAMTQYALYAQEWELASRQVSDYGNRIEELKQLYAEGKYSEKEYYEELIKLRAEQQQSAQSMQNAKKAMHDLAKAVVDEMCEAIDKETEAYQKLIDKRKEAIEKAKDEKDYEEELAEKQEAVYKIQRQLAALGSGDSDDAETLALRKRLTSELLDAEKELNQYQEDHNYDMVLQGMEESAQDVEDTNEKRKEALQKDLEDIDTVVKEYLDKVVSNSGEVYQTLQNLGLQYGFNVSKAITEPWNEADAAMGVYAVSMDTATSLFEGNLADVVASVNNVYDASNMAASSIVNAFSVSADNLNGELGSVWAGLSADTAYAAYLGNMLDDVLTANYNSDAIQRAIAGIADSANAAAGAMNNLGNAMRDLMDVEKKADFNAGLNSVEYAIVTGKGKGVGYNTYGNYSGRTGKFAKGGLVGKDKSPFDAIAQSLGEDHMIAAKEGEVVFTPRDAQAIMDLTGTLKQMDFAPSLLSSSIKSSAPYGDIYITNEVNVDGNVDSTNIKAIQTQIDNSIQKWSRQLLGKVRYA